MPEVVVTPFIGLPARSEIVALGRIKRPPRGGTEPEVEVVLAERAPGGTFDASTRPAVRWVGCGQIDLLAGGTRWTDGGLDGSGSEGARSAIVDSIGTEALGLTVDVPHRDHFPTAPVADARCFKLSLDHCGGDHPPRIAIVPQLELARALLGVSSAFMLEMLAGAPVTGRRGRPLFDRVASLIDGGTVSIPCRRRLDAGEAVLAAAYLTDGAIRAFCDVLAATLAGDPAAARRQGALVDLPFPFAAPTRWSFEGRWLARPAVGEKPRRFLMTRITSIEFGLGFDRVEVLVSGASGRRGTGPPIPVFGYGVGGSRRMRLVTGGAASPGRPTQAGSGAASLDVPEGVRIETIVVVEGGSAPAREPAGGRERDDREFSTAPGLAGPGRAGRAALRRDGAVQEDEGALWRSFARAIARTGDAVDLAASVNGWHVRSFEPDAAAGHPGAFVAEVQTERGIVVVVDAGSVAGDPCSLGLLRPIGDRPIDEADVASVRAFARASGGHWQGRDGRLPGFRVQAVTRRASVWGNAGSYADLVSRKVIEALTRFPLGRP